MRTPFISTVLRITLVLILIFVTARWWLNRYGDPYLLKNTINQPIYIHIGASRLGKLYMVRRRYLYLFSHMSLPRMSDYEFSALTPARQDANPAIFCRFRLLFVESGYGSLERK